MKIVYVLLFVAFASAASPDKYRISDIRCREHNEFLKKNNICKNGFPREYPFLVAVGYESKKHKNGVKWVCTGTLISNQHVLTPAICVTVPEKALKKYVLLGTTNTDNITPNSKLLAVTQIVTVPEFNYSSSEPYSDKNLAALELESPVEFSDSIQPACLFDGEYPENYNVAGFKFQSSENKTLFGEIVNDDSVLVNDEDCRKKYDGKLKADINFERHFCTLDGKKACGFQLSSGSPLLIKDKELECMQRIAGLTDIGPKNCIDFPVLNLKISAFIDWIETA